MRAILYTSLCLLMVGILAPTALPQDDDGDGGLEYRCYETSVSPGGTVPSAVLITNDTDRRARFRVNCRIRGDHSLLRGKADHVPCPQPASAICRSKNWPSFAGISRVPTRWS